MIQARAYQERTLATVEQHRSQGARAILVVAPTGAGKTHMGAQLVRQQRTLWVAHRRELVLQAAAKLRSLFGSEAVGVVMADEPENLDRRIQVGTVQTLIARRHAVDFDLVMLDEAHHYLAEEWRALVDGHHGSTCIGLTATPERSDGEPLGDIFDHMVVAASYSELVAAGYLVEARVLQPPEDLGNDLAQDPIEAWRAYAEGSLSFGFAMRVASARGYMTKCRAIGVCSETISALTPKTERDESLKSFTRGDARILWNVGTLTEGVDVPAARTALLCRNFGHVGGYLQVVGRVLRPSPRKTDAIVIDLCGSTIRYGSPTQDRVYSLTGKAISDAQSQQRKFQEREAVEVSVTGQGLVFASYSKMSRQDIAIAMYELTKQRRWQCVSGCSERLRL